MSKHNAAAETIKARTIIALPELLKAGLAAGKEGMSDYYESKARMDALMTGMFEASRMFREGEQLLLRLIVSQKEALEADAQRSLAASKQFLDLAESVKDFIETGNYDNFQKTQTGKKPQPAPRRPAGPAKVIAMSRQTQKPAPEGGRL